MEEKVKELKKLAELYEIANEYDVVPDDSEMDNKYIGYSPYDITQEIIRSIKNL